MQLQQQQQQHHHQSLAEPPSTSATNGDISRVYIGGLDRRATHSDLAVFCQQAGQVRGCRVAYDHATNASKCYGYTDYATPLDALRAVAYLNGALLFHRPCRVTPVLRDTSSRKGAVRENVAGLNESPAQLAALDRATRDEKIRGALAWRINAQHSDHADSLSRAFIAALGHEPAALLALLAYPTLLEAWVWEALGAPAAASPTNARSANGSKSAPVGSGAAAKRGLPHPQQQNDGSPNATPPTPTGVATNGSGEDVQAMESRLDEMVRTFSEDGGAATDPHMRNPHRHHSGGRDSSSPDSCISAGTPLSGGGIAHHRDSNGAHLKGSQPVTEAALRGALQQYPFLLRVSSQSAPPFPTPAVWRGGLNASAGSSGLSLNGHVLATPVVSPASMSPPFVSAASTPGVPGSTGSGPMLPSGGTAHVSPLMFGALPPHLHHHHHHHHHHQHHHQHHHHQHGSGLMPPSPINMTGLAHHHPMHFPLQQPSRNHGDQSCHPQQPRPAVGNGPQFPPPPHAATIAALFRMPTAAAGPRGSRGQDRAVIPSPGWGHTSAPAAAPACVIGSPTSAATSSSGLGYGGGGPTLPRAPPPPPMPGMPAGFLMGAGMPFTFVVPHMSPAAAAALHSDPTRSLPIPPPGGFTLPGLGVGGVPPPGFGVPPSFPPPGLHRQQRLARQQQQQQQRQIVALAAAASGNGPAAAVAPHTAMGNNATYGGGSHSASCVDSLNRGGASSPSAGAGHLRCLSADGSVGGALLPDLAASNPEGGAGSGLLDKFSGPRRFCVTSSDSGTALDLLLQQSLGLGSRYSDWASDVTATISSSGSNTALNTVNSNGSGGSSSSVTTMAAIGAAAMGSSMQW